MNFVKWVEWENHICCIGLSKSLDMILSTHIMQTLRIIEWQHKAARLDIAMTFYKLLTSWINVLLYHLYDASHPV